MAIETFSGPHLLRHYGLFAKKRRPYKYGRPYLYASIDRICCVIKVLLKVSNAELTPGLRRVVSEWYEKSTGQVNLKPTSRELNRGNLVKRMDSFARDEIEIVIASFAMHSDGKMPDVQVEKAEKWLRVRSKSDERALRALPGKSARSSRTGRSRESDRSARSRPRASEEESLWESAIRLRSVAGDLEE